MKRQLLKMLILFMCGAFLFSCAGSQKAPVSFQSGSLPADMYGPKVQNFLIVFDSSSSMGSAYLGQEKLQIAKGVVESMNQTLPELGFTSGMRSFGHCSSVTHKTTMTVYGMEQYTTAGLASALDSVVCAGGNTPLGAAISAAGDDLKDLQGKIALIVVSDGKDLLDNPFAAAEKLAADFGDRLCIYTIQIGDDAGGAAALDKLAKTTGCGFSSTADGLSSKDAMQDFVKEVFLTPAALDSDGDGVLDPDDRCPDTPRGVKVDKYGCPPDLDGDGVLDYMDKCPGTPAGATVNAEGCWIIGRIHFNLDKFALRSDGMPVLQEVLTVMKNNPSLKMRVDGYTCNLGSQAYNEKLSMRRAEAAKDYLVSQGIDSGRILAAGHYFKSPIASNENEDGRSMNRRAEFTPFY